MLKHSNVRVSSGKRKPVLFAAIEISCVAVLLAFGCGKGGPATKVLTGIVTCGGEKADAGQVRFVPIGNTPGSVNVAEIRSGHYRVAARGGVPLGRYRVEVTAEKKTGKQVMGDTGFELGMIDETVLMGPEHFAGPKSPLTVEVTPDGDGQFDIVLPVK